MDGWGIAPKTHHNAIANANTPNIDRLIREYPNTSLKTDGESVGLQEGQFGTSEINHLTIGSGRVIMQDLTKINSAIASGDFYSNARVLEAINHAKKNESSIQMIGLISDGGVHAHTDHIKALFETANRESFAGNIYLHLFADGRDVPPKSIEKYMTWLDGQIEEYSNLGITIATLQGRVFLDRDRDWDKTETAFQLINKADGHELSDWKAAMNLEYNRNNKDEFFEQFAFTKAGKLKKGDSVIVYHYRSDRQYQLTKRILDEKIEDLLVTSFIKSSEEFDNINVIFPRDKVEHTLAETIAEAGISQMHITETEKFPHLTYFLNGEREQEYSHETWKMFDSNRFVKPQYNFEPSMRNFDIAKEIIEAIKHYSFGFIVANFASPDMVGHTGNYEAAVVSAESVDHSIGKIYEAVKDKLDDYVVIITADHGNSEIMWDEKNDQPHTQHTFSRVPLIVVSKGNFKLDQRESLEDIAPTVLDLLNLDIPDIMTGTSLVLRK